MADLKVLHAEPPSADAIAKAEQILTIAREDEISSIAAVLVHRDGTPHFFWSAAPSMGLLVGAVARLQARLIAAVDE